MKLGEPLDTKLRAYCMTQCNAPMIGVIRTAVREHIERNLESSASLRGRYADALAALGGNGRGHLRVVK